MPQTVEMTLEEIAGLIEGRLVGDGSVVVRGIAPLDEAGPGEITFLWDRKQEKLLHTTRASAVIVKDDSAKAALNLIVVREPQLVFARLLDVFRPQTHPAPGISGKAEVRPGASIGEMASIGAFTFVEEGARIGDRTVLYPGVYVGRNSVIGEDCVIYPGVSIREDCYIGSRVIIHSNSVIGSDGFGYARVASMYYKIPQRGIVRVEDDVEIGACVTIDRATIGETSIGRGTKIDNLVQVAHNVKIGEDSIIVAQVGIAGSTKVGSRVQLGGQVGVVGHIEIGDGCMVGAKSGVTNDLAAGSAVSGIPAIPHGDWLRSQTVVARLPELKKKISELEKRLKSIEDREEKR